MYYARIKIYFLYHKWTGAATVRNRRDAIGEPNNVVRDFNLDQPAFPSFRIYRGHGFYGFLGEKEK